MRMKEHISEAWEGTGLPRWESHDPSSLQDSFHLTSHLIMSYGGSVCFDELDSLQSGNAGICADSY